MTDEARTEQMRSVAELRVVESFEEFFRREHAGMVRALTLALGDSDLGRDASAEAFTRALQRWDRVRRFDRPVGWLYRVGVNWGRSRRRTTRREVTRGAVGSHEEARADVVGTDPSVIAALARLDHSHRAVIVAKHWLDWSERDIAEALGVRPGTVKSRLSRAHSRLAADLGTSRLRPHGATSANDSTTGDSAPDNSGPDNTAPDDTGSR